MSRLSTIFEVSISFGVSIHYEFGTSFQVGTLNLKFVLSLKIEPAFKWVPVKERALALMSVQTTSLEVATSFNVSMHWKKLQAVQAALADILLEITLIFCQIFRTFG